MSQIEVGSLGSSQTAQLQSIKRQGSLKPNTGMKGSQIQAQSIDTSIKSVELAGQGKANNLNDHRLERNASLLELASIPDDPADEDKSQGRDDNAGSFF